MAAQIDGEKLVKVAEQIDRYAFDQVTPVSAQLFIGGDLGLH